jgi:hypothetical protein
VQRFGAGLLTGGSVSRFGGAVDPPSPRGEASGDGHDGVVLLPLREEESPPSPRGLTRPRSPDGEAGSGQRAPRLRSSAAL